MTSQSYLPYKNTAAALIFSVLLGPVGLLYASFWMAIPLIVLATIAAFNQLFFLMFLTWLISCIWSVKAVDNYNKKLMNKIY